MGQSTKADIWMPLYVADYVADTPYLTTEQHGAYLLLLMAYWRNGPPPDNDAILSSLVKMTPDAWSIARAVLVQFFDVSEGFWMHKRVEKEIHKAQKNRSTAHDKAAKAAVARWEKERARKMLEALPEHMPEQCPSPSPSPSSLQTKPDKEQKQPRSPTGSRLPTDWTLPDDWYSVAVELGIPSGAVSVEADKFRDHWIAKSGKDGRKSNWLATWRTWCRNAVDWTYKPKQGGQHGTRQYGRLSAVDRVKAAADRAGFGDEPTGRTFDG